MMETVSFDARERWGEITRFKLVKILYEDTEGLNVKKTQLWDHINFNKTGHQA